MADEQIHREADLIEKYHRCRANCDKWHKRMEEHEKFYDLEHYSSGALPGERRITLTKATNVVDLAVGILPANELTIQAVSP